MQNSKNATDLNCIESIAKEMVPLLQSGKTPSEVTEKYSHEDADLIGEALVEAMALMAGESGGCEVCGNEDDSNEGDGICYHCQRDRDTAMDDYLRTPPNFGEVNIDGTHGADRPQRS